MRVIELDCNLCLDRDETGFRLIIQNENTGTETVWYYSELYGLINGILETKRIECEKLYEEIDVIKGRIEKREDFVRQIQGKAEKIMEENQYKKSKEENEQKTAFAY